MPQRKQLVDLLLGVLAILREHRLGEVSEDGEALPPGRRDMAQTAVLEERGQDLAVLRRSCAAGGKRIRQSVVERHILGVLERVQRLGDLREPLPPHREPHALRPRPFPEQVRRAQPLNVPRDVHLAQPEPIRELGQRARPGDQDAADAQPRRVGDGLQRSDERRSHGAACYPERGSCHECAGTRSRDRRPFRSHGYHPMVTLIDPRDALAGRRIGPHLPLATGLKKAPERAREIGATAVQVFTDNPTAWRRREAPPPEVPVFRARLAELGIGPLAIHGPYLVNLAGSDADFWQKSLATVVHELETGRHYGAAFVNFHVGSHRGSSPADGIARLASGLAAALDQVPDVPDAPILVLENSAGGGDGIGSTIPDLARILEAAVRAGVVERRIGFCLDTAHLWGAGHDLRSVEGVDAVLAAFDAEVGAERLQMLHLNDSRAALGSRADRHEHVGAGSIGRVGLRHLLTATRLAHVATFLETPGMDVGYDAVNMDRVRLLIADEPLPDLPPDAFRTRADRSGSGRPETAASGT